MKIKKHKLFQTIYHIAKMTGKQFRSRALSAYSGQTAFFLILSFFPFLLFLFTLLQLTPLTEEMLTTLLLQLFPSSFRTFISNIIHDIYTVGTGSALSISIISTIWLSSKAFLSLIQGFNSMYLQNESRNYIVIRIFAFLYSILFALLILAILTIFVFGNWIQTHIFNRLPILQTLTVKIINLRLVLGFLILFTVFLFLYRILPNCKWKLRCHIPGALLATLGWLIFSYLYSYYVDRFNNYSAFYGTMTTIALLMIWLYACMYILFLGGILNEVLKNRSNYLKEIQQMEPPQ